MPAFTDTLVCAHCEQRLGPRTGPHRDCYKDVAHARGIVCPTGGSLQVRQEVVARQFGELVQRIPLLRERAESSEEIPLSQESARCCEEMKSSEYTDPIEGYPPQHPKQQIAEDREHAHQVSEQALLAARTQLLETTTAWPTASPEKQRAIITTLFEPGGISYDLANEHIVALVPRLPFVPWFRALPGAHLTHTDWERTIVLVSPAETNLQPVHLEKREVQESPSCQQGNNKLETRRRPFQRRPGPDQPAWKIDPSHWPEVRRRVEQGESLRQVARAYEVSHETIRRVLVTQQKRRLVVTGQG